MTDPKPFVIPPDLPADVMQYERGWNACLEALAVAPAGELPALPEAAGSFHVQNFRQDPGMRNVEFQERTEFGQGSHILFTADQMHAYAREALAALAPEPATAGERFYSLRQAQKAFGMKVTPVEPVPNLWGQATPAAAVPNEIWDAPALPEKWDASRAYVEGWNACREAAIAAAPNRPADAQRGVPARWNGDDVEKAVHVLTILHNDSATECDKDGRAELAAVHRDAVSLLEYTLELHREHQSTLAASPADPLPASEVSP